MEQKRRRVAHERRSVVEGFMISLEFHKERNRSNKIGVLSIFSLMVMFTVSYACVLWVKNSPSRRGDGEVSDGSKPS